MVAVRIYQGSGVVRLDQALDECGDLLRVGVFKVGGLDADGGGLPTKFGDVSSEPVMSCSFITWVNFASVELACVMALLLLRRKTVCRLRGTLPQILLVVVSA